MDEHGEGVNGGNSKTAARRAVRAARKGCQADEAHLIDQVRALLADLPGSAAAPRRVCAYSSYGAEPATGALIDALVGDGHTVLLPRIEGEHLAWVPLGPATVLDVDPRGIRQPRGSDAGLAGVDVVLLPALAVTVDGHRLGQGGGFYDRTLAALPADARPRLVAVVYDHELLEVPSWPVESHDIIVDAALTVPCRSAGDDGAEGKAE